MRRGHLRSRVRRQNSKRERHLGDDDDYWDEEREHYDAIALDPVYDASWREWIATVRRQVGIGTIVDIRDAARENLDRVFGLYLSSYTIVLDDPHQCPLPALVEGIAGQTRAIKRRFTAVKSYTALMMAKLWWGLYRRPRARALLFQKHVPVAAGTSNVNMTGSWVDHERAGVRPSSNGDGHAGAGVADGRK